MAFKSPEAAVRNALITNPDVAELLGARVFPVVAPATTPLPFAIWRRASVQRDQTLSGPSGVPRVLLEMDLYATTYEGARELADRCRLALDGWGGVFDNTVTVSNVSLENESDGFITLQGGESPPVYSVTQTYSILWQES